MSLINDHYCKLSSYGLLCLFMSVNAYSQSEADILELAERESVEGFTASIFTDINYTDNVAKKDTNKQSDVVQSLGLDFGYAKQTRAMDAKAKYRLENKTYRDDSFSDEVWLSGYSSLVLSTSPERYSWLFKHQQSAKSIDLTQSDTPDNRDERSTFITGPDVNLLISPVDRLSISARSIDTRLDKSTDNNSDRITGDLRLTHSLNVAHRVSLVASYSDVDFAITANDYRQQSLGLDFSGNYRKMSYQLGGGNTTVSPRASEDLDDFYANAMLNFKQDDGRWGLSYNRVVTDSSVGLSLHDYGENSSAGGVLSGDSSGDLSDIGFDDDDANIKDSDVVKRTQLQLYYFRQIPGNRFGFSFKAGQDESDYEKLLEDTRSIYGLINVHYDMAQNLKGYLNVKYQRIDFIDEPGVGEDEFYSSSVGLRHESSDRLTFLYKLSYEAKDNEYDYRREYDEFSVSFNVNYRLR